MLKLICDGVIIFKIKICFSVTEKVGFIVSSNVNTPCGISLKIWAYCSIREQTSEVESRVSRENVYIPS